MKQNRRSEISQRLTLFSLKNRPETPRRVSKPQAPPQKPQPGVPSVEYIKVSPRRVGKLVERALRDCSKGSKSEKKRQFSRVKTSVCASKILSESQLAEAPRQILESELLDQVVANFSDFSDLVDAKNSFFPSQVPFISYEPLQEENNLGCLPSAQIAKSALNSSLLLPCFARAEAKPSDSKGTQFRKYQTIDLSRPRGSETPAKPLPNPKARINFSGSFKADQTARSLKRASLAKTITSALSGGLKSVRTTTASR